MSSSQTSTRRLVRRTDDRVIAGVASGLADLLGIDPVLVRIGFVVLAFAGGAGLIAYLALWLLTPEVEGGATPVDAHGERGPAFWIAIGLFVLAALAIADSMADRSVVWPLVLIGAGVALWRSDGSRSRTSASAPAVPSWPSAPAAPMASTAAATEAAVADAAPPQAPTGPVAAPTEPMPAWTPPPAPTSRRGAGAGGPQGPSGPGGQGGSAGWTPPPARNRDRSVLGRLTVGAALLAVGVLAVLDATDVLALTLQDAFAVALLVVGLGLIVGTWVGRARWLAFPALLVLLPGLVLTTVAEELDVPLRAGIGERSVGTTAPADVEPLYEIGAGELTVNLGELDLDGGQVETSLHVGIGQARVVVPDDAEVDVTWHVVGGRVDLLDGTRQGRALEGREVFPGEPGAGTVVLDVEVALGEIEVVRESDRPFGVDPLGDTFDGVELGSTSAVTSAR